MNNLQKHQGKIFTKDNLPDLLEYLADYMREYPECKKGFGLELKAFKDEHLPSEVGCSQIISLICLNGEVYRPIPLTKTMYNIHTGEAVEVPDNIRLESIAFSGANPAEVRRKLTDK